MTLTTRQPVSEHAEQVALIQWATYAAAEFPCLRWLHSSLNGARLTPAQAGKQKATGMRRGVADLFLPKARIEYGQIEDAGLYIEMKTKRGTQTEDQKAFQAFVTGQGYRYVLARSWPEAAAAVLDYLGATDEQKARLL